MSATPDPRAYVVGVGDAEGLPLGTTSLEGLVFASTTRALADAGLQRDDVDAIVIAAADQTDGRAISSMLTAGPAGAYLNDEINIASSPGHAFAQACMQIESGVHCRVLVGSWGKASEIGGYGPEDAERLSLEPYYDRNSGMSRLAALGMQAGLYRQGRAEAAEAAVAVAVKNHANGALPGRLPVTAEDVAASPLVAEPLRSLEVARPTDGAFAFVLSAEPTRDGRSVAVTGMAWNAEAYRLSDRELDTAPHLRLAAANALRQAGIDDPAAGIDVWELADESADAELIAYEAVGLCRAGGACELALAGATGRDAAYPVNPLGGAVAGEPPFGGPMRRLVRASRCVRGEAPGIRPASRVFVQIASGFAGQFQTAFVLEEVR